MSLFFVETKTASVVVSFVWARSGSAWTFSFIFHHALLINFSLLSANSGAEFCTCNVCWPTTTWFLISVVVDDHLG